jgi:hypothetical protein
MAVAWSDDGAALSIAAWPDDNVTQANAREDHFRARFSGLVREVDAVPVGSVERCLNVAEVRAEVTDVSSGLSSR